MSGFQTPKEIENYLNLEWRKPPESFINTSLYYTGLNPFFINYMNTVVRPCAAYMSGAADGVVNSGLKMNIGYTIRKTATKVLKGDRIIFDGEDKNCKILSDNWSPSVNFEKFLESTIDNLLYGTTIIKLNKDLNGRCVPTSQRVDRYYATTDDYGNVIRVTIFNSLLFETSYGKSVRNSFWLVEERYYKKNKPYVQYKVHAKSGIAGSELLPPINSDGLPVEGLPDEITNILKSRNITVNKEIKLPYRDGLGVWILTLTANNSSVPGLAMGDPLLYGALDLLWSVDMVFSGSLTDVILGKGKILVPKRFLDTIRQDFAAKGVQTKINDSSLSDRIMAREAMQNDEDNSFVYIATERDKEFPPQAVQFNIRSEEYKSILELYLRQIVTHCGFAPTSIFPFLVDNSAKTATEVTAEENLTRATVQTVHQTIEPVLDRLLNEVLYQLYKGVGQEYNDMVHVKLSDYVGNKIMRDENIRSNYQAGLMPKDVAVQQINRTSNKETNEYLQKLEAEKKANEPQFGDFFPQGVDYDSKQGTEQADNFFGRGGSGNPFGS